MLLQAVPSRCILLRGVIYTLRIVSSGQYVLRCGGRMKRATANYSTCPWVQTQSTYASSTGRVAAPVLNFCARLYCALQVSSTFFNSSRFLKHTTQDFGHAGSARRYQHKTCEAVAHGFEKCRCRTLESLTLFGMAINVFPLTAVPRGLAASSTCTESTEAKEQCNR